MQLEEVVMLYHVIDPYQREIRTYDLYLPHDAVLRRLVGSRSVLSQHVLVFRNQADGPDGLDLVYCAEDAVFQPNVACFSLEDSGVVFSFAGIAVVSGYCSESECALSPRSSIQWLHEHIEWSGIRSRSHHPV